MENILPHWRFCSSNYPYDPIRLDGRYGMETDTPIEDTHYDETMGRDTLPTNYTSTGVLGQMAIKALRRLAREYNQRQQPFSLSVHFNAPHPPMVATYEFMNYYYNNRNELLVPPSIDDDVSNSFYTDTNGYVRV